MINKILCYMWGCMPESTVELIALPQNKIIGDSELHSYDIFDMTLRVRPVKRCKHCGEKNG